jgi:hypothetical protein
MSKLKQAGIIWGAAILFVIVALVLLHSLPYYDEIKGNLLLIIFEWILTAPPLLLAYFKTQKIYSKE